MTHVYSYNHARHLVQYSMTGVKVSDTQVLYCTEWIVYLTTCVMASQVPPQAHPLVSTYMYPCTSTSYIYVILPRLTLTR